MAASPAPTRTELYKPPRARPAPASGTQRNVEQRRQYPPRMAELLRRIECGTTTVDDAAYLAAYLEDKRCSE